MFNVDQFLDGMRYTPKLNPDHAIATLAAIAEADGPAYKDALRATDKEGDPLFPSGYPKAPEGERPEEKGRDQERWDAKDKLHRQFIAVKKAKMAERLGIDRRSVPYIDRKVVAKFNSFRYRGGDAEELKTTLLEAYRSNPAQYDTVAEQRGII